MKNKMIMPVFVVLTVATLSVCATYKTTMTNAYGQAVTCEASGKSGGITIPTHEENPKWIWERKKIGIDLRQKFELYFVSLIFTLAGLSVQTAKHHANVYLNLVEILGWITLLVSGLVGLWRLNALWRRELGVAQHEEQRGGGNDLTRLQEELTNLEGKIRRNLRVQCGFFVVGICLIIISRAMYIVSSPVGL